MKWCRSVRNRSRDSNGTPPLLDDQQDSFTIVDVVFPNDEQADGHLHWRLHKPIEKAAFERIVDRAAGICTRLSKHGFIVFSFHITSDAIIIGNRSTAVLCLFPGNLSTSNTHATVPMYNSDLSHCRVVAAVLFLVKLEMGNDIDIMVTHGEPACIAGWSLVRTAVDGLDTKDWRELVSHA